MRDIKANGGAAFIANTSVDLGNNTGWIINTIMPKSLYWIGNSGNWIDPAHWSLTSGGASSGCIPTIYDDVFFDANSFTIFGSQVTVYVANQFEDPAAYCKNMNWTGATNSPYLSSNGHASSPLCIYGSLTFISGMNIASFEGSVYFKSVNAGQTITSAGKQFVKYGNNFYFDGIGGYVLQDAFSTTGTLNLNKGQLNFNGKNVTASSFNSNNSNIRNLILGNSAVTITGNTAWNCNSTNFALSAGSSVITFTYNGWVYFSGGAQTYNNLVFSYGSGTGNIWDNNNIFNKVYFTGDGQINSTGNTFSKITFKSTGEINGNINTADSVIFTAGHAYTLSNGNTFSINNYLEAKGDCGAWINIESDTPGSQATMNSAAASGIKVNNVRMRDIKATGGATFIANTSVDLGNNTGWTINSLAQKSLYWIGNSGNWNDPAHWSLTSGGTSSGCIPTIYDDVFFDANSFTLFGSQVTIYVANQFEDQAAYCNNMNWTGATNSPYLSSNGYSSSPLHIYGSLTLISGMNIASFEGSVYFKSVNAGQTITSAGKQFVKYGNNIYFDGIGGYILQDAFSTTGTLNLNKGQLNFNGKNVKATSFNSNNSNIRNLILGNSAVTITGNMAWNCSSTNLALSAGSSVITFTYNGWAYFGGGAQTYNNLVFSNGSGTGNIWDNNNNIFNKVYFAGDGQINSTGNTFSKITFMSKGDISGNTNIADSVIFTAGHAYTLGSGNTLKVNKYLEAVGTAASYITLQSSSGGSQTFIQKSTGNVCNEYLRLKDINAGGGADFFAGNSVDLGNNTGWHYCSCSSAPLAAGTISGTATVCQGQTNVTYTLPVIANATSYVWTLPTGVTGTSITNSISVSFGNTALSGSIRVKGLNDCGGGTESTFAVVINEIPATPVITLNTGILLSNAASGNQWYLSNSIIPNAINNTYTPSQVGDYHVIITLNGCSSQTSNIVTFNPTGIEETADKYGISVYPNPTSDILKITLNKKPGSDFVIEIYDNVGSLIQTQRKSKSETNFDIDLSSFSTGIYTLRIHASNGYSQTKVVKK